MTFSTEEDVVLVVSSDWTKLRSSIWRHSILPANSSDAVHFSLSFEKLKEKMCDNLQDARNAKLPSVRDPLSIPN